MLPTGWANCSSPGKNASAAGTVRDRSDEVSEIANTTSFQAKKKTRIAAVSMPGRASGTSTRRNACPGVAPSACAASSISQGSPRKNAVSVHIASGSANDRYGMTSPGQVS